MGLIEAKKHLKKYNKDNDIIILEEKTATVEQAAKALNIKEDMIAKSLTFNVNGKIIMILTKGTAKIDNSKFKSEFKTKAKMLNKEEVDEFIKHPIGGVCPFGINENIEVFLDISLKEFEYVYPACGTDHSAIKLTIAELETISNMKKYIDVCK